MPDPDGNQHQERRTPQMHDVTRNAPGPSAAWWRVAAIGAGALVLATVVLVMLWLSARSLALLFAAIAIAEAIAPLVTRLDRRLPRTMAVVLAYLGVTAVVAAIGWVVVPHLVRQAQDLAGEAPSLVDRVRDLANRWDVAGEERLVASLEDNLGRFTEILVGLPFAIASSVTQIVLVLFMSAYWLISKPALRRFAGSLVSAPHRRTIDHTAAALGQSVGGYVRGEVILACVVGILSYAGLRLIGVEYPLLLATIAALGELIPVIGPIISAVPAVFVGLLDSPTQALIVLAFYLILQQIESNIVLPNVMDKQADVPPLLALVALFAGAGIAGILGAVVAIPLAGALKVIVTDLVAPAVRAWTGTDPVPDDAREPA